MGDHGYSWLTFEEIINFTKENPFFLENAAQLEEIILSYRCHFPVDNIRLVFGFDS
jgi:hypothetical protein